MRRRNLSPVVEFLEWMPALLFFSIFSAFAAESPSVISFSPEGSVKGVSQVRAVFSDPMVPFGDIRSLNEPFDIDCSEKGTARWVDARNWIFDFARELPAAVTCQFQLKDSLKNLSGQELSGKRIFSFDTGALSISLSTPSSGSEIQEDQVFILTLDGNVEEKWVLENTFFVVEGIQEQISVKIITGSERDKILKSDKIAYLLLKKEKKEKRSKPLIPVVVIQARRIFPPHGKVTLVWGKQEQKISFKVRQEFLAKMYCEKESLSAGCIPLSPIFLKFSAEVARHQAEKIKLRGKNGIVLKSKLSKADEEVGRDSQSVSQVRFDGPFQESSSYQIEVPTDLKDDSGRKLDNQDSFPLEVTTDSFPPLVKFSGEFGILEASHAILPVTLRNAEGNGITRGRMLRMESPSANSMMGWLSQVSEQREGTKRGESILNFRGPIKVVSEEFVVPKPTSPRSLEVVGVPLDQPGFYIVEIESRNLGKSLLNSDQPMYVSTAALVTQLSVHFKWGKESSLVWVSSLEDGKPVANASVALQDCKGNLLAQGTTQVDGLLHIPNLPDKVEACHLSSGYSAYTSGIYVTAKLGNQFSFVHSEWNSGIEYWRFGIPRDYSQSNFHAHTVFDRPLYRIGDVVHMKHFMRRRVMAGFEPIPLKSLPSTLEIRHVGGEQKYVLPLKWENSGSSTSDWTIPPGTRLGDFSISLISEKSSKDFSEKSWTSGGFKVGEFRVPLMKGQIHPPADLLVSPTAFPVDLSVNYLAGGVSGRIPTQFRYQQTVFSHDPFPGYERFDFSNGPVLNDKNLVESNEEEPEINNSHFTKLQKQSVVLDKTGGKRVSLSGLKKTDRLSKVAMELEFKDPNGEIQTVSSSVPIYPASHLIGIHPHSWAGPRKSVKFSNVLVDAEGKPVVNVPVQVNFVQKKYYSHRKKLIGGFYAYESRSEIKDLGKACEGRTDANGLLICDVSAPASGHLFLQAKTRDEKGNTTLTHASIYVYDREESWFLQGDDDRIDLLPEKKQYEPGETAIFQVRMPFREATGLVTVEREGILNSFVVPLSGKNPVVEVPILKNYGPNVFVSVLVVRGRVGDFQPTAQVDLGKPAYKLGIAEIKVGWRAHTLKVQVTSDQPVYPVKSQAEVKVQVESEDGQPLPSGSEVVVVAVDEGLLQLASNESWKLLDAMMTRRSCDVDTSTAHMQVIGKRHFGSKAFPHGGGGGLAPTRELFDTLLFWKSRIYLDKKGEATVKIPLNDSITSFRIMAIASSGTSLFGSGSTTIRSTQDLMVLSSVSPLAREGDHFPAGFTVRNTTQRSMKVELAVKITGVDSRQKLQKQTMTLAGGESKLVQTNIDVPVGVSVLSYEVQALEKAGKASDHLKFVQKVLPAVPVRVFQSTLAQVEGNYRLALEQPKNSLKGKGGVRVRLDSSLAAGLTGVKEYMGQYPFTCLEQKISVAISLRDSNAWKKLILDLPVYLDEDGLLKYFPSRQSLGSETLTSYVLAVSHEAGWEIPEPQRKEMLQGLKKFVSGTITRKSPIAAADLVIRKLAAFDALSRYGEAKASELSTIDLTPQLWPTSAVIDWLNLLNRIEGISDRDSKIKEANQILRARLNFQGTRMGFSSEEKDELGWLMVSSDVNANRLILAWLEFATELGLEEELARLMLGSFSRQQQGHWNTTPSNTWGVLATEKFVKKYEKNAVTGSTDISYGSEKTQVTWPLPSNPKEIQFTWKENPEDLTLVHSGSGKPWATIQSLAALPLSEPLSSGYKMKKTWLPIERARSGKWSPGDLVRVHIDLEAQMDSTWVVLSDPIPAGATILGSGLGNDSTLSLKSGSEKDKVWDSFEERSFEAFRSYYPFIPKGKWSVDYTLRLNQAGHFVLPPTRTEAMYSPDIFGEIPNGTFNVVE